MNTISQESMYEWKALPWKKLQRNVYKLQKRIYQASQNGTCFINSQKKITV